MKRENLCVFIKKKSEIIAIDYNCYSIRSLLFLRNQDDHLYFTATRSPDYCLCTSGIRKIEAIFSCGRYWKKGFKAKYD